MNALAGREEIGSRAEACITGRTDLEIVEGLMLMLERERD